jgi:phospholipase C
MVGVCAGRAKRVAMRLTFPGLATFICCTAILAGCGGGGGSTQSALPKPPQTGSPSTPIAHVVLVIQENRTFNNFFATYPGADGTTTGSVVQYSPCNIAQNGTIPLAKSNLVIYPNDLNHRFNSYYAAYDNGNMDAFDKIRFPDGQNECTYPYQYTDPSQIQPYWTMAEQYTLAEHMFTTQGSTSFVAHQDLIRGGTQIDPNHAIVNDPTAGPWGCDAPRGAKTDLITQSDMLEGGKGPFPCTKNFPSSYNYETLRDLLDAKAISWKYYVPPLKDKFGSLLTAFDAIAAVRYGPEWKTNVVTPQTRIFKDISSGNLPAVSWLIPDANDSDHPGEKIDDGPSWVASVVNAIGNSKYWGSTAIIIVWDDWGGLYDNLPPAQHGFGGLGFRVPAIIVSPYSKAGTISQTNYEFGSILKYIEQNWNLGSLGTTDKTATSIIDCFDYSQSPIPFKKIPSKHSKAYFIHRPPSYLPVDTDM